MSKKVLAGKATVVTKGVYDDSTQYYRLNVVTYDGSSYIAKSDVIGVLPTDTSKWQLLAQKGDSPIKGVDYFTESEINEFKSDVEDSVKTELDFDNTISGINEDINDLETNKADKTEIPDVSSFIDNNVNDLTYYYKSSETYTKTEIDNKISSVYKYKGSVATYNDLPSQNLIIGDTYNVESDGSNYSWNGTAWDKLGGDVDLSNYYNKDQTDTLLGGKQANITSGNKLSADLIETNNNKGFISNSEKTAYGNKYDKPNTGIPKTDLASTVQASLDLADSAIQSHQDISGKLDVSKVKNTNSTTSGDVYDVTYINSLIGDIDSALDIINGESVE